MSFETHFYSVRMCPKAFRSTPKHNVFRRCACSGVSPPHYSYFFLFLKKGRGRHLTHDMSNAIYNKSIFYEFLSLVLPRRLPAFASDAVGFSAQGLQNIDKAKNHDCSTVLVHLLCTPSVYRFRTQKNHGFCECGYHMLDRALSYASDVVGNALGMASPNARTRPATTTCACVLRMPSS